MTVRPLQISAQGSVVPEVYETNHHVLMKHGVVVYIDNTYLPYDYPISCALRYYSEQYLLATMLKAEAGQRCEVLFPCTFVVRDESLGKAVADFWGRLGLDGMTGAGNGFWFRVKES